MNMKAIEEMSQFLEELETDFMSSHQKLDLLIQLFSNSEMSLAARIELLSHRNIAGNTFGAVIELYENAEVLGLYIDLLIEHLSADQIIQIFLIPNQNKEIFGLKALKESDAVPLFEKLLYKFFQAVQARSISISELMNFLQQVNAEGFNWGLLIAKFSKDEQSLIVYIKLVYEVLISEQVSAEALLKFIRYETSRGWVLNWFIAAGWSKTQAEKEFYNLILDSLNRLPFATPIADIYNYLNIGFIRFFYLQMRVAEQSPEVMLLSFLQAIPRQDVREQLYQRFMDYDAQQQPAHVWDDSCSLKRIELLIQIMHKYEFNAKEAWVWHRHGMQVSLCLKNDNFVDDIKVEVIRHLTGLNFLEATEFVKKILDCMQADKIKIPLSANSAGIFHQAAEVIDESEEKLVAHK